MNRALHREIGMAPLSTFQLGAILVCIGLNMLDGFDILAMSFAASGVKAQWGLTNQALGGLLTAGLIGMGLGSLAFGPMADRFGRRPVVLTAAAIAGLGMLLAAFSRDMTDLYLLRAITGFGIGGTIASVAVIVSEYAPDRWRRTALAIYATGYSIGATVGGAAAAVAIPHYGWRAVFVIGGTMALVLWPIAYARLPESLDFLLVRQPAGALERVNRMLEQLRCAAVPELPPVVTRTTRGSWRALLRPATALAWVLFFCTMAGFYFVVSWTPRLLTDAGLSASQGMFGGVLLNLGGIGGCGLYALLAARFDAQRLLALALGATAIAVVLFASSLAMPMIALPLAIFLGLVANASMAGLYAVGPPLYATEVRATGMGLAIGIGRIGAIIAPQLTGWLLDQGWTGTSINLLFCVPFALAALACLLLGPVRTR
jgi:benzoate transport